MHPSGQFFSAAQVPAAPMNPVPAPMVMYPHFLPQVSGRKRRPKGIGDKNGGEKRRIRDRLNGFHPKQSLVWREIKRRFGNQLRHGELLSIAEVAATFAGVFLDRDAKRRKSVLIKWFQENWNVLLPYLSCVVLEDKCKKDGEESTTIQNAMPPVMVAAPPPRMPAWPNTYLVPTAQNMPYQDPVGVPMRRA